MSHLPTQSLALLFENKRRWAASCIKMANRTYTGPITTNAAT